MGKGVLTMRLRDVRVEYRENPIGLDVRKPRFSWKLDTEEYNTIQTAYQIYITYYDKADKKEIVAWNSGKVESDQSVLVEYSGGALQAETQYKCVIQVWDNHENCATEEVTLETGLLTIENIVAEWITHDVSEEIACPVFVKTFSTKKKVVQARMYATALGLYEIAINGQRVGDFYFTPGWTNYHKRLQYQTYDVTKILTTQENHIEITVADGWYKGPFGFTLRPNIYGNRVGALAQLHIAYEDGTEEVVCTDSSWSVTTGQIRYSQIYMGETIDCNCKVNEVFPVKLLDYTKEHIIAQESEPVRITKRFPAKKLIITPKGEKVLDFGQNLAGFVKAKVGGKKGDTVIISHAETLDKDGNFYPETLRQAKSMDTYICDGNEQVLHPHFTFHGFRYIKVEGLEDVVPNILDKQDAAAAWSDAATIIPWTVYQVFGDKRILEEQYDSMKGYIDYITDHCGENGLWQTGFQYGDWLALDKEESADRTGATDKYLVANAYYAYSTKIVYETAKVLGYVEDAKQYKDLYEDIVEKFNEEYITTTGRMVSETQTGCILALYFDLAEEKYRKRITESLKTNLANHKNHLATGFVGTPYLCHTLTENGLHDLAGTIFLKEDYPSWLYAVKKGATTIWERWNSIMPDGSFDESGMNSLNHYAYGSIGDWMYEKLAGIQLVEPGYKVINIEPQFMKGLTEVDATFESVYGTIRSAWSCKDGKITVDITIPPNTVAYIKLPEKDEVLKVGSGIYHYEYETLSGTYDISVGTSLVDTPLCKEITVIGTVNELGYNQLPTWYVNPTGKPSIQDFEFIYGETIPPFEIEKPGEFTLLNTLNDMKDNVVVQQIIEGMKKGILTTCGGDENSSEYIFTSKLVLNTPLIRLVQQGGGVTPLDVMKMAVDAANGKMMG